MTKEEALAMGIEELGYADEEDPASHVSVELTDGHSGHGWYAWPTEYPDEGSHFVGPETAREIEITMEARSAFAEMVGAHSAKYGPESTMGLICWAAAQPASKRFVVAEKVREGT